MHKQIRVVPAKSPADLKAFLEVLAAARINIVAAGGSDVEQGGEFAFAVTDGQEADAIALLRDAGYQPREARRLGGDRGWGGLHDVLDDR